MGRPSKRFRRPAARPPRARTVALTAVIAAVAAATVSLSNPATLRVDGQRMTSDVPPVTTPKEAYVPLRAIASSFGADVDYDAKAGVIELVRANDTLRFRVGERAATLNGRRIALRAAPFEVRGRTMVALSTVARAFRTKVRYEPARARIDVLTSGADETAGLGDVP